MSELRWTTLLQDGLPKSSRSVVAYGLTGQPVYGVRESEVAPADRGAHARTVTSAVEMLGIDLMSCIRLDQSWLERYVAAWNAGETPAPPVIDVQLLGESGRNLVMPYWDEQCHFTVDVEIWKTPGQPADGGLVMPSVPFDVEFRHRVTYIYPGPGRRTLEVSAFDTTCVVEFEDKAPT